MQEPRDFEQSVGQTLQQSGQGIKAAAQAAAKFASQDYIGGTLSLRMNMKYIIAAILVFVFVPIMLIIMLPSVLLGTLDSAVDQTDLQKTYSEIVLRMNSYFVDSYEDSYEKALDKAKFKNLLMPANHEISFEIVSPYGTNMSLMPEYGINEPNEILAIHGVLSQHDITSEYNDITETTWGSIEELDSLDEVYDRKFFKVVRKYAKDLYIVGDAQYQETGTREESYTVVDEFGDEVLDEEGNPVVEYETIHIGKIIVDITKKTDRFMAAEIERIKEKVWNGYLAAPKYPNSITKTRTQVDSRIEDEIAQMKNNLNLYFSSSQIAPETSGVAANRRTTIKQFLTTREYAIWSGNTVPPSVMMPFSNSYITSDYGYRTLYGVPDFHSAIDFAWSGCRLADIPSPADGVVAYAYGGCSVDKDPTLGYGNLVIIYHGKKRGLDLFTLYGHCERVDVVTGQTVYEGQSIGGIGQRGNSTGYHLHFEVNIVRGDSVYSEDPKVWLNRR